MKKSAQLFCHSPEKCLAYSEILQIFNVIQNHIDNFSTLSPSASRNTYGMVGEACNAKMRMCRKLIKVLHSFQLNMSE